MERRTNISWMHLTGWFLKHSTLYPIHRMSDQICANLRGPGALKERSRALARISRELERVYEKGVVVLIGEYDTHMHSASEHKYTTLVRSFILFYCSYLKLFQASGLGVYLISHSMSQRNHAIRWPQEQQLKCAYRAVSVAARESCTSQRPAGALQIQIVPLPHDIECKKKGDRDHHFTSISYLYVVTLVDPAQARRWDDMAINNSLKSNQFIIPLRRRRP